MIYLIQYYKNASVLLAKKIEGGKILADSTLKRKKLPKENSPLKRAPGAKAWLTVLVVLFSIYSVALLYPMLWLLMNSVKDKFDFLRNPMALPKNPFKYLGNFTLIFWHEDFNLATMFATTLVYAVATPTIGLLMHAMIAYAFAKYHYPGKKFVYACMVIPMFVFLAGTNTARLKLYITVGIYDNLLLHILLTNLGGGGTYFLLFSGMFANMSDSYREAAMLDGAGRFRIFITIYVPQAMGLFSAMWIMQFITAWNAFEVFMLYLPSYQTLATGIYNLTQTIETGKGEFQKDYPKMFAAMVCSIIPVFVLFVIFQDTIMQMTFGGGVKG